MNLGLGLGLCVPRGGSAAATLKVTVPGAQSGTEDVNKTITGTTIENAAGTVTVTITGTHGVVSLAGTTGLSFSVGDGTSDATMTFTASQSNANTALATLTFRGTSNFAGAASIAIQVADGVKTRNKSIDITLVAVDDVPTVTCSGGTTSWTEQASSTIVDGSVTVTDVEDTLVSATVQITTNYVSGEDQLAFTNANGITGSWNATTGLLTLSGAGTVSAYQTALRTITYVGLAGDAPTANTRVVTFKVSDATTQSSGSTKNLTVTAVNDAPTVTTSGGSLSYTENAAATVIDSGIVVADADNANLTGATVQISSGYQSGQDVLSFTNAFSITGAWNSGTGVLTLSGTTTKANYQSALRTVKFNNTSENPNTSTRTVTFTVNDGTTTGSGTRNIAITAVNDAPYVIAPNDLTIDHDTDTGALDVTIGDVDESSSTLTLSYLSSTNPSLIDGTCVSFGGSGSARTVTVTPKAGESGVATVTLRVTDAGTLVGDDSFVVTVTGVSVPVADSAVQYFYIPDDANSIPIVQVTAVPPGFTGGSAPYTYEILAGGDSSLLSIDSSTGIITVVGAQSWNGWSYTRPGDYSYVATVQVTDGASATATCTVVVIPQVDTTDLALANFAYSFTDPGVTGAVSRMALFRWAVGKTGTFTIRSEALGVPETDWVVDVTLDDATLPGTSNLPEDGGYSPSKIVTRNGYRELSVKLDANASAGISVPSNSVT